MKHEKFCQSCHAPLDNDDNLGTEADGSPSKEYCWLCYQQGMFTNPYITLTDMQHHVMRMMERRHEDERHICQVINILPELKRWYKPARV
jgi:predicted amidophosphoribosyltransferase